MRNTSIRHLGDPEGQLGKILKVFVDLLSLQLVHLVFPIVHLMQ